MIQIQQILKKVEDIDLKKDNAVNLIHEIISTELKELPAILTYLDVDEIDVDEILVRSRFLCQTEDFHFKIQDIPITHAQLT